MKSQAIATPYIDAYGQLCWEWNFCPDCGRRGAHHHDKNGRGGVRCG